MISYITKWLQNKKRPIGRFLMRNVELEISNYRHSYDLFTETLTKV